MPTVPKYCEKISKDVLVSAHRAAFHVAVLRAILHRDSEEQADSERTKKAGMPYQCGPLQITTLHPAENRPEIKMALARTIGIAMPIEMDCPCPALRIQPLAVDLPP